MSQPIKLIDKNGKEAHYESIAACCAHRKIPTQTVHAYFNRNPDKTAYVSRKHKVRIERIELIGKHTPIS